MVWTGVKVRDVASESVDDDEYWCVGSAGGWVELESEASLCSPIGGPSTGADILMVLGIGDGGGCKRMNLDRYIRKEVSYSIAIHPTLEKPSAGPRADLCACRGQVADLGGAS